MDVEPFALSRDHDVAPLVLPRQLKVSLPNTAVELQALQLESALRSGLAGSLVTDPGTPQTGFWFQIEQNREAGPRSSGHELIEGPNQATGQPSSKTLVGNAGIGESIGDHDEAFVESRPDDFLEVLGAVGKIKSELDLGRHSMVGRMQENPAYLTADLRASRLPGQETGTTRFLQSLGKELGLRGLATTLDPFEADQKS